MPRVIRMEEHTKWGDNIYFADWEDRTISGHMTPLPQKGDFVSSEMQSGKVARFEIVKVEYFGSVKDQFWGQVKDLGYEED